MNIFFFTNALEIGSDGFAQLAPFGDFKGTALVPVEGSEPVKWKKVRAIQRVDKAAVAAMVEEFQNSRHGLTRFLKSRPIYKLHPDMPGFGAGADKTPKGVIANIQMREDGLFGELILTDDGEKLVAEQGHKYPSARWAAEEVGEENGVKIFRPTMLYSVGLTPNPNLPVQMLNEAEEEVCSAGFSLSPNENKNTMKREKIIAVLTKHSITIANDATDEQLEAALETAIAERDRLQANAATLATEKTTLANSVQTLESSVTARTTEITNLKTERDNLKTSFANERKARIDSLVGSALAAGRITAAEKPDWERRLGVEAQFANEAEAIEKLDPKLKTKSVTVDLGSRKVELANSTDRSRTVNEVVGAISKELKCDYGTAFAEAERRHPALFAAMNHPEIEMPHHQR